MPRHLVGLDVRRGHGHQVPVLEPLTPRQAVDQEGHVCNTLGPAVDAVLLRPRLEASSATGHTWFQPGPLRADLRHACLRNIYLYHHQRTGLLGEFPSIGPNR